MSKSTYFKRKPNKLKTWKHPDWTKGEWQLDHVCMDKFFHKEIHNVKVLRRTDTGSDHYLIRIKIKFTPLRRKRQKTVREKRTYDPQQLMENDQYREGTGATGLTDNLDELIPILKQNAEDVAPLNPWKRHA